MFRVRSFIAIDICDNVLVSKITNLQEYITKSGARLKLVEPQNLHFTLRFLGEIPVSLVEEIKTVLQNVKFNPFDIYLKGLGAFPTIKRPRVIWIGVTEGADNLVKLSSMINDEIKKLRLPPPDKPFTPHLTIARVKKLNPRLNAILEKNKNIDIGLMKINKFYLKKSTLTSRGPIYETLAEYELK